MNDNDDSNGNDERVDDDGIHHAELASVVGVVAVFARVVREQMIYLRAMVLALEWTQQLVVAALMLDARRWR